ncbi:MAG: hypothetical protein MMC23_000607 [Stictis urceolatum]|nr:hypothetical protein [Stictis urceolata]
MEQTMEQTTDVAQALKGLSVSQHIDGGPDVAHYFCAIDFGTVLTAAAVAKVCTSGSFNAEGQEDTKILVLDEVRIIDRYIGADNGKVRDVEVPSYLYRHIMERIDGWERATKKDVGVVFTVPALWSEKAQ